MDKRVIIITGSTGVGKTLSSRLLASKLGAVSISLGELIEREKLFCGIDKKRGSLIADVNKVFKRVHEIVSSSDQSVIIEGNFVVDIKPKKTVNMVFVLRRNPQELKSVLERRGFSGNKLWENIAAEILDVCLWDAVRTYGVDKVCEIDATGRSVEEIVEDMLSIIKNEKECRVGLVDWLGKLEEEGKINEYLKHF